MADLKKDIKLMKSIFDGKEDCYDQIYPRPTEDMERVLDYVDMSNKDVYGVLASSEIVFQSKLRGANSIRTFDINPLTYRYFFFRKWLLEQGYAYADGLKRLEILDIIDKHIITENIDEEESVEFWKKHIKIREKQSTFSDQFFNFYAAYFFQPVGHKYPISYENKIEQLVEMLKSFELEFDCLDICQPLEDLEEKYDIVYLSNILDLKSDTTVVRDNLYNLLKKDGCVICTNIKNPPYGFNPFGWQQKTFSDKFDYEELFIDTPGLIKNADNQIKYYRYIKK
ncbi:MAG: hypothetical protein J1F35_02305 [Erysipelotrichales bacterium]|nr:hypothetical protein [Erysipelotrichales bacterium]